MPENGIKLDQGTMVWCGGGKTGIRRVNDSRVG